MAVFLRRVKSMALVQHKILILDDNPEDRATYRRFLQHAPNAAYAIWEATPGETGLAVSQTVQPDCVLLNLASPDHGGLALLTRLREHGGPLSCAIIVLTENSNETLSGEALKQGAQDSLRKEQMTEEILWRTVEHAIEKVQWTQRVEEQRQALVDLQHQLQTAQVLLQETCMRERLAAIGTAASRLTHHLGNRFNNLFTSVQLLERKLATSAEGHVQLVHIADDLQNEITRSLQLLQDLRVLSTVPTLHLQPTDVLTVVNGVLNDQAQDFAKRRVRVSVELPTDLPPAQADPEKLARVVLNLCTNAVEAMPQGGTLILSAKATEAQLTLNVQDTGVGIAIGFNVFEPLISTKPGGTGLGLAIVYQLMAAQHGTVTYTSTPGQGTTFTLALPRAAATTSARLQQET